MPVHACSSNGALAFELHTIRAPWCSNNVLKCHSLSSKLFDTSLLNSLMVDKEQANLDVIVIVPLSCLIAFRRFHRVAWRQHALEYAPHPGNDLELFSLLPRRIITRTAARVLRGHPLLSTNRTHTCWTILTIDCKLPHDQLPPDVCFVCACPVLP